MKKAKYFALSSIILLMAFALVGAGLADSLQGNPPPPVNNATDDLSSGIENITGSTVNYVDPDLITPGSTVDMCFNVYLTSPDTEYLDGFDVDLPDAWTVNTVYDTIANGCGFGHTLGVGTGNVLFWYTNGMPSGCGDWIPGTYNFCANVTVPDCAGWDMPWNIWGDNWGSPPHSVSGIVQALCNVPMPDLSSSTKEAPLFVPITDTIHYVLTVENTGALPANGAVLTDVIPADTAYVPGSLTCTSGECTYDSLTNAIYWEGQISPGLLESACSIPVASPATSTGGPASLSIIDESGAGKTDPLPLVAPDALWPGPDGYGYTGSSATFSWVDITTSGTAITGLADDNFAGPFPIGFTFSYYGAPWTDFYASSNGFLSFGAGSGSLGNQCPLPNSTTPDNVLAMLWDDINFNTSGQAYYQTFGTCPIGTGTCLVVEYYNTAHYGGSAGSAGTWEAILFGDGSVIIQYQDSGTEMGSGSSSGIEGANFASDHGLTFACDSPNSVLDNTAIAFALPTGVFILPETQDAQGCAGVPQDHTFTIFNSTGMATTVNLDYTITAGVGTCTGPASVDVPDGGSVPVVVTVNPFGNAGDLTTCEIYAEDANNPGNYDYAYINKTIVDGLSEWTQITDEPNLGRMDNVTAGYNNLVWSITGYGADANVRNYDPATNTWTVVGTPAPFGINYARSGCTAGNTVYLYGDSTTVGMTGLWSYNMDTTTWAQVTPSGTPPVQTGIWAPAWAYDEVTGHCFMTGGATTPGAGNLTTTYVYDPVANAWLAPLPNFTHVRDFHAAFIYENAGSDRLLCVVGGNDTNGLTSTQCYNFTTGVWNAENADIPALPGVLWGMGYATKWHLGTDHQLWLMGGVDASGSAVPNTLYFDVNTLSWLNGGNLVSGAIYRTSAVTLNNDVYKISGSSGGFTYTGWSDHHVQLVCPPGDNPVTIEFDVQPLYTGCGTTILNEALITDPDMPFDVWVSAETEIGPCLPPEITVTGGPLDAIQLTDMQTMIPIEICNIGDDDLNWNITEYTATMATVAPDAILWDNGPLVTMPAACSGMDASRLQTDLSMNTLGFGHQFITGYRMADDFIIDGAGWQIDQITFFAYQTSAPQSPSPITGVYFQIWDGPPDDPGSTVVFGDLTTNRLLNSASPNMQRDSGTSPCANNRYIFADIASAGVFLPAGTYWLDWMTDGSLSSGPWAPPVTILGQITTGNALQYTTAWGPALDSGTSTQQDMPFIVEGSAGPAVDVPWLSEDPTSGSLVPTACETVDVTFDSAGLAPGEYLAGLNVNSNDPVEPVVDLPASLTVVEPEIELAKTVGTDSSVCATTDEISVDEGTTVYYCYTVTNTGDVMLDVHDLEDDILGAILIGYPYDLMPGASVFITVSAVIDADVTNIGTWTAYVGSLSVEASDTATVNVIIEPDVYWYYLPINFKIYP